MTKESSTVLIIYTGGTIGMRKSSQGALEPIDFSNIHSRVPEIDELTCAINTISFTPLIDSSNVTPSFWQEIATVIEDNYNKYCGFVVLHGTDTMAFSASMLSFMLQKLSKPVVFTGSQLPIGSLRTDGRANLIAAIEIASAAARGELVVPEVSVCFQNKLLRGNRVIKHFSELFNAFYSHNYPTLADVGIKIKYNIPYILPISKPTDLEVYKDIDNAVAIVKLFPGMQIFAESAINSTSIKAIVLETYGAGNAPTHKWFIDAVSKALSRGIIVVNISQCPGGHVDMGVYESSVEILKLGVINGKDLTTEAAVTKLMHLLGRYKSVEDVKLNFHRSICGEFTTVENI